MNEDTLKATSMKTGPLTITIEWISSLQQWHWHAVDVNEEGQARALDVAIMQAFERVDEIHEQVRAALNRFPKSGSWTIIDPLEVHLYDGDGKQINQADRGGVSR